MNKEYYYHDGNNQIGPVNIEQLKTVDIKPDTWIWIEGLDDWKPAKDFGELKNIFEGKCKITRTRQDIENDIQQLEQKRKAAWAEYEEIEKRYIHGGETHLGDRKANLYRRFREICEEEPIIKAKIEEELREFDRGKDAYQSLQERRQKQANREELENFKNSIDYYKKTIEEYQSTISYESRMNFRNSPDKIYAARKGIERNKGYLNDHLKNIPNGFSLLEKADILSDCSNYESAITCYDKYLKLHPNSIDCLIGKAKVLYYLSKTKETIICCDKILKLDPNNWSAAYYKKEVKRELNNRRIGYIVVCCIIIAIILLVATC